MTTYILLWGSIREPFTMKMMGDQEYLLSYTKGFSELPSPAQVLFVLGSTAQENIETYYRYSYRAIYSVILREYRYTFTYLFYYLLRSIYLLAPLVTLLNADAFFTV